VKHKDKEYEQARSLRLMGASVRDIARQLSVAKSTVSIWVRDIKLTDEQIARLNAESRTLGTRGREKFTQTMQLKRQALVATLRRQAEEQYETLRSDPEFMFGLALYIGEGSKGGLSTLIITNWNPCVITQAIHFFEQLGMPRERMRCKIVLHPNQDVAAAETFWSHTTGLPLTQFARTYHSISPGSRGKRGQKWPHGGCRLSVSSVELRHKLNRWMELALQGA
jgi:transposase-like protein